MDVSKFNEKFNKLENNIYTVDEEIVLDNGVYNGHLAHDNINKDSLNIYTGLTLTGDKITNYFLSTPSETPWKYNIKIFANVDKVYVSYETIGDQVESYDINNLQDELVRTQQEVNIIEANKADKDKVFTKEELLQKFNDLINSAPGTLDTLNEIATALGNDPNFSATIINLLNNKVDKVEGRKLSTEDYGTQEKNKLSNVEDNANNYIHPKMHPANIITEDETHMFVTAKEKAAINISGSDSIFETAGGTATVITLTFPSLTNGLSKNFIVSTDNGGGATTINGKKVYRPGTTTPPTFKKDKAYTVWYNLAGDCFFIKASAEGDADVSHVLATKKFSNDNDIGLVGAMPNNGALNKALSINGSYTIPAGYTSGGIVTQNITTKAAAAYNPSTSAQTIAAGQYLTGAQTINPMPYVNPDISTHKNAINITAGTHSGDGANYAYVQVHNGNYLNGVDWYRSYQPYLVSQYIVSGANIFGIAGTATPTSLGGKRYKEGSFFHPFNVATTIELGFTPRVVKMTIATQFYSWVSGAYNNYWIFAHSDGTDQPTYVAQSSWCTISGTQLILRTDLPGLTISYYAWE